jgi:hypothetical protein
MQFRRTVLLRHGCNGPLWGGVGLHAAPPTRRAVTTYRRQAANI